MTSNRNKYVPRVNQIDAIRLNKDITHLLRDNLLETLQTIAPVFFLKIQPEIDLFINSAIWLGSVGKNCSSFGQQLLVLSYDVKHLTTTRLVLHFTLTVLPTYIKRLSERRLQRHTVGINKSIELVENAVSVLSILNFFRFLKTGRKPTLVDYLLGLDYISLRHNQRRDIGYKYLTRELLWGGFMEILSLILPIINFSKLSRLFKSYVLGQSSQRRNSENQFEVVPHLTPSTTCAFCGDRPTLPHHVGCGHIYCYYCLYANVLTDAKFSCTKCGLQCSDSEMVPV